LLGIEPAITAVPEKREAESDNRERRMRKILDLPE
jgi:hypothetical protein